MRVTRAWLEENRTPMGGFRSVQALMVGEPWPVRSGWMDRAIGRNITKQAVASFIAYGKHPPTSLDRRLIYQAAKDGVLHVLEDGAPPKPAPADPFLSSSEWKRVRLKVLMRDGATCACCGASPQTGARMNVDHIKPRKTHPALALDLANLQVLCADCNHGKGNWCSRDFRKSQ